MTVTPQRAIIAGAGIGGLTAGIALARRGWDVSIHELAPELGEVGAGLTLYMNAIHVYEDLGLADRVIAQSMEPTDSGHFHWQTGELLAPGSMREESPSGAQLVREYRIHRADLHRILVAAINAAAPGALFPGEALIDARPAGDRAIARFSSGRELVCDVLIGADGIRSRVREVTVGLGPANFTGYVAWRAMVATDRLTADALVPSSAIFAGPTHRITRYLVRHGQLMNVVIFGEQPGWETESWTEPADMPELRRIFADWHPRARQLIENAEPAQTYKWALFDRNPLERWRTGRITLLGDAAHAMLPFIGQGAGMAIEDAGVLARCLDTFEAVDQALDIYEALRKPRTRMAFDLSRYSSRRVGRVAAYDEAEIARRRTLREIASFNPMTMPLVPPP